MLWTFEKLMVTMFTKMSVSGSCEHFSPLNLKKKLVLLVPKSHYLGTNSVHFLKLLRTKSVYKDL